MGYDIETMRILVLGGTRFIGRLLVRRLVERGHDITVCSRGNRRPPFPAGVNTIWGNREDPAVMERVFAADAYDCVVDNIAYNSGTVSKFAVFGGKRIGRYMLTSTAWVYLALCPEEGQVLSEHELWPDPSLRPNRVAEALSRQGLPDLTQQYVTNKMAAEAAAFQMEFPVTIVRPGMVAGQFDHNNRIGFYVQGVLEGGPIILIEGGVRLFQLVWVNDLARAMMALIETSHSQRSVYNIAPPDSVSVAEIVALVEVGLGRSVEKVVVARTALQTDYPDYETYEPFALPVKGYYDSTRLLAALPQFHFTAPDVWIKESTRWVVKNQPECADPARRRREREITAR